MASARSLAALMSRRNGRGTGTGEAGDDGKRTELGCFDFQARDRVCELRRVRVPLAAGHAEAAVLKVRAKAALDHGNVKARIGVLPQNAGPLEQLDCCRQRHVVWVRSLGHRHRAHRVCVYCRLHKPARDDT